MADRCHIKGCPDTPKYSCTCGENTIVCEDHLNFHLGLGHQTKKIDIARENIQSKIQMGITGLFGKSSEVLTTGKQMFIDICNKLCNITDDIFERQQNLLKLSASQSYSPNVEDEIRKMTEVGIKTKKEKTTKK